ncbi:6-hydroxymethylpterin diphosphokinase MptE-like protein [Halomarina ordinaria]|uniref:6-hydroxymethyl-7,8-dihydropterin pyrophosphokinase n=1 Tax=Halomarina ordinaria TaxID=3033939 RepID=A0ABD5U9R0_9EURY|nr:6-hydroxymethylpterin diphosphokinase MptE-like protein [Halomarina sp. PSRA2]
MLVSDWLPVYEAILDDFGFDRAGDERVRDRLAALTDPFDLDRLAGFEGASVAIAGGGPSLDRDLADVRRADVVVAASNAAAVCRDAGLDVDLMVTDLDKVPAAAVSLTREGTPVAVAAHGDNRPEIEEWVPRMRTENVLPTTQAEPVGSVVNFGGFTDGDRAAFLADHLGARTLTFAGWDLDDPSVDAMKRRKLVWAERLLRWLELRRDERFALLDGRREGIDTSALPVEK